MCKDAEFSMRPRRSSVSITPQPSTSQNLESKLQAQNSEIACHNYDHEVAQRQKAFLGAESRDREYQETLVLTQRELELPDLEPKSALIKIRSCHSTRQTCERIQVWERYLPPIWTSSTTPTKKLSQIDRLTHQIQEQQDIDNSIPDGQSV